MCHFGNTGLERRPSKSQQTKLTLEKKIPSFIVLLLDMLELRAVKFLDYATETQTTS